MDGLGTLRRAGAVLLSNDGTRIWNGDHAEVAGLLGLFNDRAPDFPDRPEASGSLRGGGEISPPHHQSFLKSWMEMRGERVRGARPRAQEIRQFRPIRLSIRACRSRRRSGRSGRFRGDRSQRSAFRRWRALNECRSLDAHIPAPHLLRAICPARSVRVTFSGFPPGPGPHAEPPDPAR